MSDRTLYRQARERVSALVGSLGPQQLEIPVPSCPGWTVHDVVSHLAGVANDVITGRLTASPPPRKPPPRWRAGDDVDRAPGVERTSSQLEVLLGKEGRFAEIPV